jgi:uncharacterized protein YndB with AHSA1/START domain
MTSTAAVTGTNTLVVERDLPHPPQKVWRALTQNALLEDWLMANDFAPRVGHKFNFRSTPVPHWNGVIDCEVLIVEPETRLSYSWTTLGLGLVVTFTLTPTATGTHLRMEQSGFASKEDNNYRGATYGWQRFLGQLESLLGRME